MTAHELKSEVAVVVSAGEKIRQLFQLVKKIASDVDSGKVDLEGGEWEVINVYPSSRYSQQSVGFCSLRCILPPPSPKTVEKRFDIGTVAWKPLPELKVKRADV